MTETTNQVVIRRYKNRKLYDTSKACYVTLDEIVGMLKDGSTIKVIQKEDNKDITGPTLAAAIFGNLTQFEGTDAVSVLTNILTSGDGTLVNFVNSLKGGTNE